MRFTGLKEEGGLRGALLNLLMVLTVLALVALWIRRPWEKPPATSTSSSTTVTPTSIVYLGDPALATEKLLKAVNQKLQDMDLLKLLDRDVQVQSVTVQGKAFPAYREVFRTPEQYSKGQLADSLKAAAEPLGARLASGETMNGTSNFVFAYTTEWTPLQIAFETVKTPRICVIIDDGGYQKGKALEALYGIKVPVTVSIIPDAEFSKSLAEEFPDHGVEVMCHMPMEGHEKGVVGNNYKELLKKGMGPDQAKTEVEEALANLPHCRGLNNHMGSVATEDPELMSDVCEVLKAHGLFIIDSRTTAKSMMEMEAKKNGVPVASRNIFLDNVETPEAILKQLDETAAYAKKHGLAVAIGHFKLTTLQTLESAIPQLKNKGFQFVYASEVVKE